MAKFLLGLLALSSLVVIMLMPELTTALVLFVVYTNAPVVGYRFHGVSYLLAASVILFLLIPMAVYVVKRRRTVRWNPVMIPMFMVLCAQLLSALFARNPDIAFAEVQVYILEGLILFFLVVNVLRTEEDVHRALWAMVLAGAFMGGIVLFQRATNTLDNNYWGFAQMGGQFLDETEIVPEIALRQAGPLGEQNNFATVLLALVPMAWFLAKHAYSSFGKWLAVASLGLIIAGIVLSYSRAAAVFLAMMIPAMAYFSNTRITRLALGGIVALALVWAVAPEYVARIATLEEITELFQDTSDVSDPSLRGRASENLAAIHMFLDHPVLGVGEGNYSPLYQQYAREIALDYRPNRRPHNLYLGIAAEGGILGLAATMAVLFAVLVDLSKARLRYLATNRPAAALAGLMIISIIGRMLMGLTLDLTYERYLWLLVAVGASVAYLRPFESTAATQLLHRPLIPLPLSPDQTLLGEVTKLFRPPDVTQVRPLAPSTLTRETDQTILSSRRLSSASDVTQQTPPPIPAARNDATPQARSPMRSAQSDVTQETPLPPQVAPDATQQEELRPRPRDVPDKTQQTRPPGSSEPTQVRKRPDFGDTEPQGAEGE